MSRPSKINSQDQSHLIEVSDNIERTLGKTESDSCRLLSSKLWSLLMASDDLIAQWLLSANSEDRSAKTR